MIDSVIVFFGLLLVRLFLSGIMAVIEGNMLGGNILFSYTLKDIILYVLQVVYFILFTYCTGTTPGKRLMNLRVISAERKLSFVDVLYRETIGRFLCSFSVGIGYIVAGLDREKRGIHDMLCDTRVIYAKRVKVYPVFQGGAPNMQAAPGGQTPPGTQVSHDMQVFPGEQTPPGTQAAPGGQMPSDMQASAVPRQAPPPDINGPYHLVQTGDTVKKETENEREERDSSL